LAVAGILVGQHLEAQLAQRDGHRASIEHGVGQAAGGIVAVADDERDTFLGGGRLGGEPGGGQRERDEQSGAQGSKSHGSSSDGGTARKRLAGWGYSDSSGPGTSGSSEPEGTAEGLRTTRH